MRVEGSISTVSWFPSEAVTVAFYRVPFEVGVSRYDAAPQVSDDVDALPGAQRPWRR